MPIPPWASEAVPFARFMQWCLYDPEIGYYRSGRKIFGRQGDFYTSPYTHPFFSQIVAGFVAERLEKLGPGPLHLVEPGAGEQVLGRAVVRRLEAERPDLARRVRYHPVEIDSPELPSRIRGVVFSNEFFDALPVHRVRVRGAALKEILVAFHDGRFVEIEAELSDPRVEEFLRAGFQRLEEGFVYEANLRAWEFLEELDRKIEAATVLTIDYGFTAREYLARARPEGTLLCYRKHQAHDDPYRDIGRQDLTCHVNFEALTARARALGWRNHPLRSQRDFLMERGLADLLREEEDRGWFDSARLEDRLGLRQLLEPGGVSDVMKVLVQEVRL